MNATEFAYWLNGFVELTGGESPSDKQWASIVAHLDLVFDRQVAYAPERRLAIDNQEPEVAKATGPDDSDDADNYIPTEKTDSDVQFDKAVKEMIKRWEQQSQDAQKIGQVDPWDFTKIFPQQHPPMYPPIYPQYPTPGTGWPGMDPYFTPTVIC